MGAVSGSPNPAGYQPPKPEEQKPPEPQAQEAQPAADAGNAGATNESGQAPQQAQATQDPQQTPQTSPVSQSNANPGPLAGLTNDTVSLSAQNDIFKVEDGEESNFAKLSSSTNPNQDATNAGAADEQTPKEKGEAYATMLDGIAAEQGAPVNEHVVNDDGDILYFEGQGAEKKFTGGFKYENETWREYTSQEKTDISNFLQGLGEDKQVAKDRANDHARQLSEAAANAGFTNISYLPTDDGDVLGFEDNKYSSGQRFENGGWRPFTEQENTDVKNFFDNLAKNKPIEAPKPQVPNPNVDLNDKANKNPDKVTLSGGNLLFFNDQSESVTTQNDNLKDPHKVNENRIGIYDGDNFIKSPLALREGEARFGFSSSDKIKVWQTDGSGTLILRNRPSREGEDFNQVAESAKKASSVNDYIKGADFNTKGQQYYVAYDENNNEFIFEKNLNVNADAFNIENETPGKLVSVNRQSVSGKQADEKIAIQEQFRGVDLSIFGELGNGLNSTLLAPFTTDKSEAQQSVAKVVNLADTLDTLRSLPPDTMINFNIADYSSLKEVRNLGVVKASEAISRISGDLLLEVANGKASKQIADYMKNANNTGYAIQAAATIALGFGLGGTIAASSFASALTQTIAEGTDGDFSAVNVALAGASAAVTGFAGGKLPLNLSPKTESFVKLPLKDKALVILAQMGVGTASNIHVNEDNAKKLVNAYIDLYTAAQ